MDPRHDARDENGDEDMTLRLIDACPKQEQKHAHTLRLVASPESGDPLAFASEPRADDALRSIERYLLTSSPSEPDWGMLRHVSPRASNAVRCLWHPVLAASRDT